MKNIFKNLKSAAATIVLTIGSATTSYGANLNSTLGEQINVLQLNNSSPEPETMLLLGIGLLLLATVARKGKSKS